MYISKSPVHRCSAIFFSGQYIGRYYLCGTAFQAQGPCMMNIPADGIIISPAKIGAGLASLVSGVFTATAVKADTGVIAVQPLSLAGATTQALDAPASMRVDVTHCA
jgi:hypothetical protein